MLKRWRFDKGLTICTDGQLRTHSRPSSKFLGRPKLTSIGHSRESCEGLKAVEIGGTSKIETRDRESEGTEEISVREVQMSSSGETESRVQTVRIVGKDVCTQNGHEILREIPNSFSVREHKEFSDAAVLQLAQDKDSSRFDVPLGQLQCRRFLACARIKLWWQTPEWGTSATDLPHETQFLLVELGERGPYAVILPLIDQNRFRCTLSPPRKGQDSPELVRLVVESNNSSVRQSTFDSTVLIAAGYDPFHLVNQAVAAAASISGTSKARVDKVAPEILDYFGWCTWDAFYSTISAQGVQQGLDAFKEGDVQPKFLIIDDGWQTTAADQRTNETAAEKQAKKDLLDKSGAGGHYITNTFQSEEDASTQASQEQSSSAVSRWLGPISSRVQTFAQSSLFSLYKRYVESAEPNSWSIALFSQLAGGPLKPLLRDYYDLTSDHTQRLQSVKANGKFSGVDATSQTSMSRPEDLKSIVQHCKVEYGVELVYAWHSLHGYWAGVSTESEEMPYHARVVTPTLTPGILEIDPCFAWSQFLTAGIGIASSVSELYKDMHSYLTAAGIDGVKVDCQAVMGIVGGGAPDLGGGPAISAAYHAALEQSVARNFPGNNCINCMCHSTEDFYRMENTAIARSSDDFWPRDPASHTTHVAVNAYNSLFMGVLIQPDWDMFQSLHPAGLLHATARVISGGPIYVSDKPGQHDFALLRRLVLKDGTLLRCTSIGLPTLDTLFLDPMRDNSTILKVWNTNKKGAQLAVFNLQGSSWCRASRKYTVHDETPPTLKTVISPADIPRLQGASPDSRYAVYSDHQNHIWDLGTHENVPLSLGPGSSDMLAVVPIQQSDNLAFAAIGLVNMLNTNGAVLDTDIKSSENGVQVTVKVRGHGEFLAYSSRAPKKVSVGSRAEDVQYNKATNTVRCTTDQLENVLTFEY